MKQILLPVLLLFSSYVFSQDNTLVLKKIEFEKEKYVSANFLSMAEPQFTFGPSFGYRFTERSEVFAEAAWITKSPFYNDWQGVEKMNGARLLFQYRYHFLQQWRPLLNFPHRRRGSKSDREPFIGFEFRYKPYSFSSTHTFINSSTNDTLTDYHYNGNATVVGGALLFGHTVSLDHNEQFKLEFTAGIGGKYRHISFKNVPQGYEPFVVRKVEFSYPQLPEEAGNAYFILAVRLRYTIR